MGTLEQFEYDQERAREARRQAAELRELFKVATCGLPMRFVGIHYGTAMVPEHIAIRVAEMYPVWAAEYEAIAEDIELRLASALNRSNIGAIS